MASKIISSGVNNARGGSTGKSAERTAATRTPTPAETIIRAAAALLGLGPVDFSSPDDAKQREYNERGYNNRHGDRYGDIDDD